MSKLDPRKYSPEVQECWCVYQALRKLGFSADNIYVLMAQNGRALHVPISLFVILRSQDKEFNIILCNYSSEDEAEEVLEEWARFVTYANEGSFEQGILNEIYEASNIMKQKVMLIAALYKKGIRPNEEWS